MDAAPIVDYEPSALQEELAGAEELREIQRNRMQDQQDAKVKSLERRIQALSSAGAPDVTHRDTQIDHSDMARSGDAFPLGGSFVQPESHVHAASAGGPGGDGLM